MGIELFLIIISWFSGAGEARGGGGCMMFMMYSSL